MFAVSWPAFSFCFSFPVVSGSSPNAYDDEAIYNRRHIPVIDDYDNKENLMYFLLRIILFGVISSVINVTFVREPRRRGFNFDILIYDLATSS